MKDKTQMDIAQRVEAALAANQAVGKKPDVLRQIELSNRLTSRGLIRKETYNVVRPLSSRMESKTQAA